MTKRIKSLLDLYSCWSPILSLPTWIIVGMVVTGIFGAETVLLPIFAVLIIT